MRVMKFGGSSLASPAGLKTVVELALAGIETEPLVLVTSALAGVTDSLQGLLDSGGRGWKEALAGFRATHLELWQAAAPAGGGGLVEMERARYRVELRRILQELDVLGWAAPFQGGADPATRDRILSVGESLSSHLVASLLRVWGVAARSVEGREVIRTDSTFGEAAVHLEETDELMRWVLGEAPEAVAVMGGFTGADARGRPTTLGRGSSDLTAALAGRALGARVVEIWTDVDGVFRHNPREVPDAPLLRHLPYAEARAMALAGAKVLHPRTLDPLEPLGIPLRVRNTLNPGVEGTWIGPRDEPLRTASLILAGATGGVGSALRQQLGKVAPLLEEEGWELKLVGALNSRCLAWDGEGLSPEQLSLALARGDGPPWDDVVRRLMAGAPPHPVFVDCTASQDAASRYLPLLEEGIPVVTANKLAGSGGLAAYRSLQAAARSQGTPFRYETTVGAALPVLGTLRDLMRIGDRLRGVEGVLSGTLSFVFSRVAEGVPFSQAVAEARNLGLTEPHPGEDLKGADVGRKLVILLREAGLHMELASIPVESLVPPELEGETDPEAFLSRLSDFDEEWAERTSSARARGEVLAYVASFDGRLGEVGVRAVPRDHPLGALRPTENVVLLTTDLYADVPLKIAGPGAGCEVTASGVLADVLEVLREKRWVREPSQGEGPGPRARLRAS